MAKTHIRLEVLPLSTPLKKRFYPPSLDWDVKRGCGYVCICVCTLWAKSAEERKWTWRWVLNTSLGTISNPRDQGKRPPWLSPYPQQGNGEQCMQSLHGHPGISNSWMPVLSASQEQNIKTNTPITQLKGRTAPISSFLRLPRRLTQSPFILNSYTYLICRLRVALPSPMSLSLYICTFDSSPKLQNPSSRPSSGHQQ